MCFLLNLIWTTKYLFWVKILPHPNIYHLHQQIFSINLKKSEQKYRGLKYALNNQLTLYLKIKTAQKKLFFFFKLQVKQQVIASQFIFRDQKSWEMAIIFTALSRMTPKKRVETVLQLSNPSNYYAQWISNKALENLKNNQYISKYLKSG